MSASSSSGSAPLATEAAPSLTPTLAPTVAPTEAPESVSVRCPRGIVYDPYPGRCRLYVDRNGDGYCDYSEPIEGSGPGLGGGMVGFYVMHNAGIGLRCFAFGIFFGVGGLYAVLYNAATLGSVFGYMATTPQSDNFFHFVTAHGPFELTAVVLAAAAGMRMGFSLVDTRGLPRIASLRQAAQQAVPIIAVAVILFGMAAVIETFLSPSAAPYWIKAVVSVVSAGLLTFYFVVLGYPRGA